MTRHCPAVLVTAPASGQGKTTVTAALARYHSRQGRRVRVFKTGPDFLDPMILARASGHPVYQLDLYMGGVAHCRRLLAEAAEDADLILVEGVMGLFDGDPSSADLAEAFQVPVMPVIDASGMAQTFAALAHGLANYRPGLPFAGVVANRVGSARHAELLHEGLAEATPLIAALPRRDEVELPDRHLGLVQAEEVEDLEQRLDAAADALAETGLTQLPAPVAFQPAAAASLPRLLDGVHIAVARDAAFAFLYPANLALLEQLGARLSFFSPLADEAPVDADAVYLPGGYPELHLQRLADSQTTAAALHAHHAAGKPIHAECGGMLYLLDSLTDASGQQAAMLGLLSGAAVMRKRLTALGMQGVALPAGELRGHSFHHSELSTPLTAAYRATNPNGGRTQEAVYCQGRLTASYIHFYFPSNPKAVAQLFLP
ncbi:cobyrinate a,c-diamide synthase [Alkalilimnicola ehrlichii]|uniref:Cobyrinate a,c-diamide synthase n=1 Tax=Alkalilimnicola ehrlichii TaxID=351052 RepID=A0A3E0WPQ0_9GAMM|nr:cobyrinate a,c-diamide synthase [Alkalilimnicola ehrlichii]RFA33935.1 cobyrinic acid a,c-diamide synthase [Alkalilimnicola ehrlichii]